MAGLIAFLRQWRADHPEPDDQLAEAIEGSRGAVRPPPRSMGMIVDSSILVAFERRRFNLELLLAEHSPPAIAAVTAAELLIGV